MRSLATLRYIALPLRAAPLLLVAIFSLLLTMAVQARLFGLPMFLIIGSWFFKYGFMLLDHVTEGRPDAPVLTVEVANPVGEVRPLAYAGLAVAFVYATGTLRDIIGPQGVSAVRMLGIAIAPAVIATHAVTGSLTRALQPVALLAMIRALGTGYLLVVGIALLGGLLGRAVVVDSGNVALIVRIAALMLLWLAVFAVLGGVIHDRRAEIGFEPEHSPERQKRLEQSHRDRERNKVIDQVFAEYRSGATVTAWETIRRLAEQSSNPVDDYAWIHDRVSTWPNPLLANRVAQELLPRLLAARRTGDALKVVRSRLQADPEFRPLMADHALQLAQLARSGGDRTLARALLRDFDTRFDEEPARARARRMLDDLAS